MNASQRVEFNSLFSVRKKNYFASKRGEGEWRTGKKSRHQPSSCIRLVSALCILQILSVENCFISPLAGSAAVVLTDAGLAPIDQAEVHRAVASGTQAPGK